MDNRSLSHTRWKCQYHIVFIPKVSAKYSCGFPNTMFHSIIVGERYLDYFTTITEECSDDGTDQAYQ